MQTSKSVKRINSLQGLRFFFCILIIVNHIVGISVNFEFGGECGVSFFFILSGFILSYVYGSSIENDSFSTRRLFTHQLSKFLPLHVTLLLLMTLAYYHADHYVPWDKFFTNLFLVQSWIPSNYYFLSINGVTWFLCDILFFYLCFHGMYNVAMKSGRGRLTAIVVVVLCVYVVIMVLTPEENINNFLYANPIIRLADCFFGIILCRFYKSETGRKIAGRINGKSSIFIDAVSLALLALLVGMCFAYYGFLPHRLTAASIFWPYMLFIVFWYVSVDDRTDSVFVRIVKCPFAVGMGNVSMEVYLSQSCTILYLNTILDHFGIYRGHLLFVFIVEMIAVNFVGWVAHQAFSRLRIFKRY